jgi:hypothetical protein
MKSFLFRRQRRDASRSSVVRQLWSACKPQVERLEGRVLLTSAPTTADSGVIATEDTTYTFTPNDFSFSDSDMEWASQSFSSSGSFNAPSGVTAARVLAIGGGGGGANGHQGGGGSGYVTVQPFQSRQVR